MKAGGGKIRGIGANTRLTTAPRMNTDVESLTECI